MMTVTWNDSEIQLEQPCTLLEFIQKYINVSGCYAIAINRQFVAKNNYEKTQLSDRDHITMITPMQGG